MRFNSAFSFSVLAAAALGLTVACAGGSDNKAGVKSVPEELRIQSGLSQLTDGKYNPNAAENLKMAERLEAASATVQRLDDGKDEKAAVWGVHVRFLLKDVGPEISGQKEVNQFKALEALTNDPGVPSKYLIEAVCGVNCDRLTVILSEKSEDAAKNAAVARVAVIFKREKSLTEQKKLIEKQRAENEKNKAAGKDQVEIKEIDESKPVSLVIGWSASPNPSNFMKGGTQKTIEQLGGSEIYKAHKDASWTKDAHAGNGGKEAEAGKDAGAGKDSEPGKDVNAGSQAANGNGGATDANKDQAAGAAPVTSPETGAATSAEKGKGTETGAGTGAGADTGAATDTEPPPSSSPLPGSAPLGQGGMGHSH